MGGSGKFYCDTTLSTLSLHPPPPPSQVRNDDRSLTKHIHCSFYRVARAYEDFDATRGISSHCICTRPIHSLWTRPNLEAVLLVAMVATVDSHSHWLSHFDHLLQIGQWRSYWITNETTRKLKDKKLSLTMCLIEQRLKVSGLAISCCEDHSFTKIHFRLKKRKDHVSSFGYDFTTSGKCCFGTHIPIETIFVWLNKIIKFLLLT